MESRSIHAENHAALADVLSTVLTDIRARGVAPDGNPHPLLGYAADLAHASAAMSRATTAVIRSMRESASG
jgi:hypothetical protein